MPRISDVSDTDDPTRWIKRPGCWWKWMQTISKTRGGFKLQKSTGTTNFSWKFKLVLEPTSVKCETSVFEMSFVNMKALATAMLHWAAPRIKSESEQELLIVCLSEPLLCPPTFYTRQISAFFSGANIHTYPVWLLVQQSTVCSKKMKHT